MDFNGLCKRCSACPEGGARACIMDGAKGEPDKFIFTNTHVTKIVWECFKDGSLAVDKVTSLSLVY